VSATGEAHELLLDRGSVSHDRGPRPLSDAVVAGARWVRSHKVVAVALGVWLLVLLAAAFPSLFTRGGPNAQNLIDHLARPGTRHHLLGTDELGEDVYTRLVYGARTSVEVGFGAVFIGCTIGVAAGIVGAYFRRVGAVVSALVDVKMAFPGLILALAVVVMIGHSSVGILALVLGLTGWTAYARVIRGVVLSLREREFIEAARASGQGALRQIVNHILPNITGTVSVLAILDLSRVVLAEASLSFLGLGIQPPAVSWGLMLGASEDYIYVAWWLVTLPGLTIALVVLAANIIANSLQRNADPVRRNLRDTMTLRSTGRTEP
jgi:peptide/nickel transport system permease protein